jgi:L-ascorbate metabolism protein UlaG (beta-lactamase superfamily)
VQVQNLTVHWNNKVTNPGDSHDFTMTKDVLLLPVQAPWGTTIRAIELVSQLKPKFVLPIHDWMWNEQWRQTCYDRFEQIIDRENTTFLRPTDGQTIEINL